MRVIRKLASAAIALLVAAQFVPVDKTNPPVESDVFAPVDVKAILARSCYDCHSNETAWPWYASVAPASWLVARDVHEGREHLNFSTWGSLSPAKRAEAYKHIREEVGEGEMPMAIYLPLHPEARLTDADKAAIDAWTRQAEQGQ
jgi:hypothetical protein